MHQKLLKGLQVNFEFITNCLQKKKKKLKKIEKDFQ